MSKYLYIFLMIDLLLLLINNIIFPPLYSNMSKELVTYKLKIKLITKYD